MALKEEVIEGDATLVSYEPLVREYSVGFFALVSVYKETTTTTVHEWYALTESAATDGAGADQPETGTYTFEVIEQERVIGAYTLRRTWVVTETELVQ